MKIMIKVGYSYLGLDASAINGFVLGALMGAQVYSQHYGKDGYLYKADGTAEKPEMPEIHFVPDSVVTPAPPATPPAPPATAPAPEPRAEALADDKEPEP